MNYAKYIELPDWISLRSQILNFRDRYSNKNALWWSHTSGELNDHMPELVDAFKSLGLTARQMIFFTNLNNDLDIDDPLDPRAVFIHTDNPDDPTARFDYAMPVLTDFNPTNAINIPLLNCEGSTTLFYKLKDNTEEDVYYKVIDCGGHAKHNVEEVYRFELNKPAIIRINVPHAVLNPNEGPRVVATFRFYESTDHLLD
jgi:hypothetical protein